MHVVNNITLWFILKIQQFYIYSYLFSFYVLPYGADNASDYTS